MGKGSKNSKDIDDSDGDKMQSALVSFETVVTKILYEIEMMSFNSILLQLVAFLRRAKRRLKLKKPEEKDLILIVILS